MPLHFFCFMLCVFMRGGFVLLSIFELYSKKVCKKFGCYSIKIYLCNANKICALLDV